MSSKILIGNIGADVDRSSIEDMLTMVGDIYTCRIEKVDDSGVAKWVAHVEMSSESQARDCISRFNNTNFRGTTIWVREDVVFVPRPRVVAPRSSGRTAKTKSRVSASR